MQDSLTQVGFPAAEQAYVEENGQSLSPVVMQDSLTQVGFPAAEQASSPAPMHDSLTQVGFHAAGQDYAREEAQRLSMPSTLSAIADDYS